MQPGRSRKKLVEKMKTYWKKELKMFTTYIMMKRLEDQVYVLQKTCDEGMLSTYLDPVAKVVAQLARETSEFNSDIGSVARTGAEAAGSGEP